MSGAEAAWRADAARVTVLALDVDGVLTDGSILIDDRGHEIRRFSTRDGVALRVWQRLGFRAAIVTGRAGPALHHRMASLGVGELIENSAHKGRSLDLLVARTGAKAEEIAFLGDDWPDLPILRRVGYPMAVADAEPAVVQLARFVTPRPGGRGAVRDAVEHLLQARGLLERAISLYD